MTGEARAGGINVSQISSNRSAAMPMPTLAKMLNGSHYGHPLHLLYPMSDMCRPTSLQHPIGGTPHHQSTHHQLIGKTVSMLLLLVVGLPALVRQYPWRVLGLGF